MKQTIIIIIVSMVMALSSVNAEMINNGDQTATDTETGIMWQRSVVSANYEYACDYCEDLVFAGESDWRVPDVYELVTITDYDRGTLGYVKIFHNNFTNLWSTTQRQHQQRTFNKTGAFSYSDTYEKQQVKCVRGEFNMPTVNTHIVEWSVVSDATYTMNDARFYCAGLVENDRDDWRLPTIDELVVVIDWETLDPYNMSNTWSGTLAGVVEHAWRVSFMDGSVIPNRLVNKAYVRCVCEEEEAIEIGIDEIDADIEFKKYFVDQAGLALDGTGSIHAYPNTLNHHSLRYARHLNKKAGIKVKNITVPVLISGYVVDKLATFVYGEGVVEAYFLINEKRFDIDPDFEGNFEGYVDIVGPHKMKDWVGLSWDIELHSVDPEGVDAVVDVTNITVENFKDKPWKQKKVKKQKQNKGKGCKK